MCFEHFFLLVLDQWVSWNRNIKQCPYFPIWKVCCTIYLASLYIELKNMLCIWSHFKVALAFQNSTGWTENLIGSFSNKVQTKPIDRSKWILKFLLFFTIKFRDARISCKLFVFHTDIGNFHYLYLARGIFTICIWPAKYYRYLKKKYIFEI